MNVPERISVKFYMEDETGVDVPALIPLFHRWIQQHSLPGLLIDVVDYKHVPNGPMLLLVGHEGDYALDGSDGRVGFLYRGKREWRSDDFQSRLSQVWQRARQACRLLESEESLGGVSFTRNEAAVEIPNRLNAPNTPATFDDLREDVRIVLNAAAEDGTWSIEYVPSDYRRPLKFRAALGG
jgi:hypothetical protein